jgi:hypothetical protein
MRDSVGTSVRDSTYEATMEKTTESAIGVKRNRAGPVSSTTGEKTMQMASVDMMAGKAIWRAPFQIAGVKCSPSPRLR